MSLFKELISELNIFAQTFLGFLTFIIWAWMGRVISTFHYSQLQPFRTFKFATFITEIPIAIGMGIVLGGATEFLVNQEYINKGSLIQPAIIALGAYLGPKIIEDTWNYWIKNRQNRQTTSITINTEKGDVRREDVNENTKGPRSISDQQIIDAVKRYIKKESQDQKRDDKDEDQQKDST